MSSHARHPTPYYRYYDTNKHKSAPSLENDYEHTRCSEFIKFRRSTKATYSPAFLQWDMDSASAYSTFHSSMSDPILNLAVDGKVLTYRSAMRSKDAQLWTASNGEGIARLIDTKTLCPVHRKDQPIEQRHLTTYYLSLIQSPSPRDRG